MDKVSAVLDNYNNSLSSINGINPRFELTKGRVTESMILSELAGLRTSSTTYNRLLSELPTSYDGTPVKNIIFTDKITVGNGGNPIAAVYAEGAFWFNSLDKAIYIYINPSVYVTEQNSGRPMTLGELITHELGHGTSASYHTSYSEIIAAEWGNGVAREQNLPAFSSDPRQRGLGNYSPESNIPTLFYKNVRCFLAGTEIQINKNKFIKIEDVEVGEHVMAFDSNNDTLYSELTKKKVTNIFRNITQSIVDLRGLKCTPGHLFLDGSSTIENQCRFDTIANILRKDGAIVEFNGMRIRARTGAKYETCDDALVSIIYRDHASAAMFGAEHRALVRAGIPMPATTFEDGASSYPASTLAQHLNTHNIIILPNGILRSSDGMHHAACNWPEGSTPFDTHEARNWIVEVDGQPYTPPWIRDLVEEDEHQGLRVVGAMPTVGGTTASPRPL